MKKFFTILLIISIGFLLSGLIVWRSLYVNVKGETANVPDFKGLSVENATIEAKKLKIAVKINKSRKVFSEFIKENHIAAQDPAPGSIIKINRSIDVILSKGSKAEKIPVLIGKTLENATFEIANKNLRLVNVTYTFSNKKENIVIAQSPKPNTSGLADSRIRLLVSKGKVCENYIMPKLTMLPLSQVEKFLNNRGINFIVKTFANQIEDKNTLFIKEQFPAPGFSLNKDYIVTLSVEEREQL